MKRTLWSVALLAILFATACEEEPVPIPPLSVGDRKVLVEELSGVRCQNCPDGARQLIALQETYKENLIVVTMHADLFGILTKPYTQSDPYPTRDDFRSQEAIELVNYVGPPLAIPAASVNRQLVSGQDSPFSIALSQWSAVINQQLNIPPTVGVFIAHEYNKDTRKLDIDVNITPEIDLSGDHRLTVMITQDSILDTQKDGSETKPNYAHRHIMRDIVTRPDGDPITEPLKARGLVTKSFSIVAPAKWDIHHCSIVAFVHRGGNPDKEVLQADEVHVKVE